MDRVILEATMPPVPHMGAAVAPMRPMLRMEAEHDHLERPMEDTDPRDTATMGLYITLPLGGHTVGMEDSLRGDHMDTMLHKVMCPLV